MFILFVVGEKDFSNIVSIDWHSQNFRVRIIWHQHNPFYAFEQHDFLCTHALFCMRHILTASIQELTPDNQTLLFYISMHSQARDPTLAEIMYEISKSTLFQLISDFKLDFCDFQQ